MFNSLDRHAAHKQKPTKRPQTHGTSLIYSYLNLVQSQYHLANISCFPVKLQWMDSM